MKGPASPAATAPWYPWFKAAVFALLACNTAVYAISGTLSEALDSIAWLLLLASFELETGWGGRFAEGHPAAVLRGVRLAAAAAILAAGSGYVRDEEWLDAMNMGLWIAVVALLEFEVRHGSFVARHRASFKGVAATLYSGLGVVVLVWLWQSEWFDAYDAFLWLVAFVTIEMNLLGIDRDAAGSPAA
jgi:hypothetical protein